MKRRDKGIERENRKSMNKYPHLLEGSVCVCVCVHLCVDRVRGRERNEPRSVSMDTRMFCENVKMSLEVFCSETSLPHTSSHHCTVRGK